MTPRTAEVIVCLVGYALCILAGIMINEGFRPENDGRIAAYGILVFLLGAETVLIIAPEVRDAIRRE